MVTSEVDLGSYSESCYTNLLLGTRFSWSMLVVYSSVRTMHVLTTYESFYLVLHHLALPIYGPMLQIPLISYLALQYIGNERAYNFIIFLQTTTWKIKN